MKGRNERERVNVAGEKQGNQTNAYMEGVRAKVLHAGVPEGRVIALSDVHGEVDCLRGLLDAVSFGAGDTLVIVGDLLEKGAKSLETLRLTMQLAQRNCVHWVLGNCDPTYEHMIDEDGDESFLWWNAGESSARLIRDMMEEAGIALDRLKENPSQVRHALLARFPQEFAFMRGRAHIVTMGRYVFVHGGITNAPLEDQEAYACMKNDNFMRKGYAFDKWVVVGHWPVQNYPRKGQSASPLVDGERHIVSIDGGCGLKSGGQLNAMLIAHAAEDDFSFAAYDTLPRRTAQDAQAEEAAKVSVLWHERGVEVLCRGAEISRCRLKSDGTELDVPTALLYEDKSGWCMEDYTDYKPRLDAGDTVKVLLSLSGRTYVKTCRGEYGWYLGRVTK